ncbi:MAG: hypothetical protein M9894_11795 [Planctomycetes bacterium]|nr:hypothetical protein [Planctomycetota bacterium]
MTRRALACLLALLPLGCYSPPPGIDDAEVLRMEHVRQGDAWVFYRGWDVPRARAAALAPEVELVRLKVGALTGVTPPRAQLVVHGPTGSAGASGPLVDRVACLFIERENTIRFRYPLERDDRLARTQLLGTVAHEVAEATVLGQVTAVDPYLRWMCDGVAELAEHEVLLEIDRAGAGELLGRALRFVQDRRARGAEWLDLTRWRQLGDRIYRSQRLLDDGEPSLALEDLPGSLARVRRARAALRGEDGPTDPARDAALAELEAVVQAAAARERLGWRPGEGRTDDPDALDYLFYNAAFALWLHAERGAPGTLGRFVAALAARREADPVLVQAEALALLKEAASGVALPPLERLPLAWVEQALTAEAARLPR